VSSTDASSGRSSASKNMRLRGSRVPELELVRDEEHALQARFALQLAIGGEVSIAVIAGDRVAVSSALDAQLMSAPFAPV